MKQRRKVFLLVLLACITLLSACNSVSDGSSDNRMAVERAIEKLLAVDHYRMVDRDDYAFYFEGELNEKKGETPYTIFHRPYKAKMTSRFLREGHIVIVQYYEKAHRGGYAAKSIHISEDGLVGTDEGLSDWNSEWFTLQVLDNLVDEKFVGETVIDGVAVEKYEIIVGAYPFIVNFGAEYEKRDDITKIYLEEFSKCTGVAYIDTETGCIYKLEFDLQEKIILYERINERIKNETNDIWTEMREFNKYIITITYSDVNSDDPHFAEIEKEIDEIMGK